MSLLLESTIKISLVIGAALAIAVILRHRSAALRHWVLAAAVASSVAIPTLMVLAPSWSLPAGQLARSSRSAEPSIALTMAAADRVDRPNATRDVLDAPASATSSVESLGSLLQALWLAGAVINLAALLVGFSRLTRISSRARIVTDGPWADVARRLEAVHGLRRSVRLLQSDKPALLVTWGFVTPKVMLPVDAGSWAEDRIYVVLAHELAHVRRGDWIVQLAGELLRSVYWFNPLIWLACARVRLESEHACDDAVVGLGVQGGDYATHLLELAREFGTSRRAAFPAPAIAPKPSSLQRRVNAMLNPALNRRPVTRFARAVTSVALLAVALPIALFAQNTFATISGSIVDPSSSVLPGVSVVAMDIERRVRHEVHSDGLGRFELIGLPQGAYNLEVSLPGFETFQERLTLSGQELDRNITLQVGMLQETVAVSNSGPNDGPGLPPPDYRAARRPPNCGAAVGRSGGAVQVGGQLRVPRKLLHVSPIYPQGSPAGTVRMNAVIGVDGLVKETTVTNAAPPALAQSAIDAVQRWEFDPILLNCAPIEVRMSVLVDFR